jgi:citrate synthase
MVTTRCVADVMSSTAVSASADETLAVAAGRMAQHGVGSVVVVEGNRPIGILTERDLLRAAAAAAVPEHARVGEWMTADPECLDPDTPIEEAWQRLAHRGYRHIPAVTGGELKGIVSMRDLVALAQLRPADAPAIVAPPGLKGVVVAETALGDVRGSEGYYHYRHYSAPELAAARTFEDVWHLMIEGELPNAAEAAAFAAEVAPLRVLPSSVLEALPSIARSVPSAVAGLRTALSLLAGTMDLDASLGADRERLRTEALRLSAPVPTLIAALHRLQQGLDPLPPRLDLGHAASYLYMLDGEEPSAPRARAVEQYLILALEHGFNASTFTARVVTSTGADMGAVLVAALGALTGPLHGGAINRTLDTMDAIGVPENAAAWVRAAVVEGQTIMGFGHPVYRTADPRSLMLRSIAESIGGELVDVAVEVEAAVERTLAELKPGRELHTNVEWFASVVMELCGLPRSLFNSTFIASRIVGWSAQAMEQAADNRIIRPSARYVGPPVQPVPAA